MKSKGKIKMLSLDQMKDRHIGKVGTKKRDQYEFELKLDIIGEMMRRARKERHLTQEQLGDLVGIKKSQISKLENNTGNVTMATVLKVFNALDAKINFNIQLSNV